MWALYGFVPFYLMEMRTGLKMWRKLDAQPPPKKLENMSKGFVVCWPPS
jgi:hypothetical protein